jgi:hypothetical protein
MTTDTGAAQPADSVDTETEADDGIEAAGAEPGDPGSDASVADQLGWRGWVLVAAILVSFLAVPWTIVLLPEAQGFLASFGLGLRDAYLVLPLLPAIALASLAVWAALGSRRRE